MLLLLSIIFAKTVAPQAINSYFNIKLNHDVQAVKAFRHDNIDYIVMTSAGMSSINLFDSDLNHIRSINYPSKEGAALVADVVFIDGLIYASLFREHKIVAFDIKGNIKFEIGKNGDKVGQFAYPIGLDYDEEAKALYVADYGNNRIQIFTPRGEFLRQYGKKGYGDGFFNEAYDVNINSNKIFVTDRGNNRIQVFDKKWKLLNIFKSSHGKAFKFPQHIAFDKSGNIFLADSRNYRIVSFTQNGDDRFELVGGDLRHPKSLTLLNGKIYVSDFKVWQPEKNRKPDVVSGGIRVFKLFD